MSLSRIISHHHHGSESEIVEPPSLSPSITCEVLPPNLERPSWWKSMIPFLFPPNKTEIDETSATLVTIVCISDTHGHHRRLDMPPGDILICGGDYTQYGNESDAIDFNEWLSSLPYKHKIVVQGNHEVNAPWKERAKDILSHATLLINESITIQVKDDCDALPTKTLHLYGTSFFWPSNDHNPYYDMIDESVDIVISHCPAYGSGVDAGRGCPSLMSEMKKRAKPMVVVSGHEHSGRGTAVYSGITFVNAATAGRGHQLTKQPIVMKLWLDK